jgi:GNAT superfamily N-acetyltransferase
MNLQRIPMSCPLTRQVPPADLTCRGPQESDKEDLAILLYAAYRGTMDDEGGTFADALGEIDTLFAGGYGEFLPDCSFLAEEGEFLASASLVTWWASHRAPLVAFLMTRPEARRRGLARALLQRSMNALLDRGHDRITLVVTKGNESAESLYASLGFVPIDVS